MRREDPTRRGRGGKPASVWYDPWACVWGTVHQHADRTGIPPSTLLRRLAERGPADPDTWRAGPVNAVLIRDLEGAVRNIAGHAVHYEIAPDTLRCRGLAYGWRDPRTWARQLHQPPTRRADKAPSRKPRYDKPRPPKQMAPSAPEPPPAPTSAPEPPASPPPPRPEAPVLDPRVRLAPTRPPSRTRRRVQDTPKPSRVATKHAERAAAGATLATLAREAGFGRYLDG